ncbi:hypothetical protein Taro_028327, partial [Colocasia esculenta]|nr:hypothetical protein [Colocasia esculenta]
MSARCGGGILVSVERTGVMSEERTGVMSDMYDVRGTDGALFEQSPNLRQSFFSSHFSLM